MIVVTGAAGRLGRRVVQLLVDRGREVLATDRLDADDLPAKFVRCELGDPQAVHSVLEGAEAVVHMGAIPGPQRAEPRVIFENNVAGDFNVMMSAAELGLRRVVFSSSAFGMGWAHDGNAFVPRYLPLDEEHPMMPFEPYGLTKQVGEDIGRMIARNSDTTVVSLRFTNVALPEVQAEFPWPAPTPENPLTLVMWAYADARDVAEAHVLALDAEIEEYEAFMLAQPSSRFAEQTIDLIRANFGGRVEIRDGLEGTASVISTAKAQRMLGWTPRHDWRQ
ncbi:MAG: NAD(P)-dependent oxidoreductase [Chloroflexota bacterium]|nr:NAD(P)-dependent oxidoreductase [Chloroflexota bacterium]MDE2960192.1 NAD(P)-dependent oxidoreductase [Chloroflexota bacterium]